MSTMSQCVCEREWGWGVQQHVEPAHSPDKTILLLKPSLKFYLILSNTNRPALQCKQAHGGFQTVHHTAEVLSRGFSRSNTSRPAPQFMARVVLSVKCPLKMWSGVQEGLADSASLASSNAHLTESAVYNGLKKPCNVKGKV